MLLYCFFADGIGLFPQGGFLRCIEASKPDGSDLSRWMAQFFESLAWMHGSLFGERVRQAVFDGGTRRTLLDCLDFDWGGISPAIFGAMFQGVMDGGRRREIGAHYTSEENILKLIDPLFMDGLRGELRRAGGDAGALGRLHDKMASLRFLDPACGCGNFLIIAYRELRLLELELLRARFGGMRHRRGGGHSMLDIDAFLKVNVGQFHGIEIEEFPCQVARTGLWLMDYLMNQRASEEFGQYYVRLPLGEGAPIAHGNALRMDWGDVAPRGELSYIMGNPPYVGHQYRTPRQQEDMRFAFADGEKFGKLDYVCCWYRKAVDLMAGTDIKTVFVSTNSVVQGECVSILWRPIFERGFEISFAYTPFAWSNEARGKAAVNCVIVGLGAKGDVKTKTIYGREAVVEAGNINGYLLPAPNVFIQSRGRPLCEGLPEMGKGSQPTDGGNLILSPGRAGRVGFAAPFCGKMDQAVHGRGRVHQRRPALLPMAGRCRSVGLPHHRASDAEAGEGGRSAEGKPYGLRQAGRGQAGAVHADKAARYALPGCARDIIRAAQIRAHRLP
jgi:hypothetical protein